MMYIEIPLWLAIYLVVFLGLIGIYLNYDIYSQKRFIRRKKKREKELVWSKVEQILQNELMKHIVDVPYAILDDIKVSVLKQLKEDLENDK